MRLLIVGGSGFFGKSILDAFSRGLLIKFDINELVVMSRSANLLKITNPSLVAKNVTLVELDVATCNSLPEADYVIHAASSTDVRNYLKDPDLEKNNIMLGASNFAERISMQSEFKKVLYCSSGAVYGDQNRAFRKLSEEDDFADISSMAPHKFHYAFAKKFAEVTINELGKYGRDVSIARCFSFVGKFLPLDQHFAIGNFIHDAIFDNVVRVKADRLVYRSYLYADDLVDWLMAVLLYSNSSCPIFNVGSDQAITANDLAKRVAKRFDKDIFCENKISEKIDCYVPSVEKIRDVLGVSMEFDLDASIEATIQALLKEKYKC